MQISEIANVFSALGNPRRLFVFLTIVRLEPICVCDIMRITGYPQSSVSRALSLLRLVGLVNFERRGTRVCYYLNTDNPVVTCLKEFLNGIDIPEASKLENFEKSC